MKASHFKIICSILVICIIILIVLIFANCRHKPREYFTTKQEIQPMGYANIDDPYEHPYIISDFIDKSLCQNIIQFATPKLFDSRVIGGKNSKIRNSQQCWIDKNLPIVKNLYEKASKIAGLPITNAEDLQVVRYKPGQYYSQHHDACCDDNSGCSKFLSRGGQRVLTILIYLNEGFGEGSTYFRNLDKHYKPSSGNAIVFHPLATGSSKCHPLALHSGTSVTFGEKWVANIWFREHQFK